MPRIHVPDHAIDIYPISDDELEAVLNVYKQCEDFLALGPVPVASMQMVLKDIELSRAAGGLFCGIYAANGDMIGILDFVPSHYDGIPSQAFLELLMIAAPFRRGGIGKAIVEAFENEIRKNDAVTSIMLGVQVNNPQALRFWERNGYHIVSGPELMEDQTTVFAMRKDL